MSGYLQRLVQRAEGVAPAPSLVPGRQHLATRDEESVPLMEDLSLIVQPAHQPLIENRKQVRSLDWERPPSEHTENRQRRIIAADHSPLEESLPSEVTSTPAKTEALVHRSEPKEPSSLVKEVTGPEMFNENPINELSVAKSNAHPHQEAHNDNFVTPSSFQRGVRRESRANEVVRSRLEPSPRENFVGERTSRDEPHVVIGQLRVEVVRDPPQRPREIVRTVTQTVGPNQTKTSHPFISRQRFGLGQM